jgi:glutathione S-transferase
VAWLALALAAAAGLWWWWESRHRRTYPVPPGLQGDITLPHEREFELYHNALSLCSMKTRVCLAELGVSYESHPIDLVETGSYETLSRHFLEVNPGGTVPVLVHHGHPVYESHEQIRYAAAHAPEGAPSLVPEDSALRAEMERWVDRSSLTKDPIREGDLSAGNAVPGLTLPLFAAMIDRIAYGKILEGLLFHFDKKRPVMFLLFKARGLERLAGMTLFVKMIARSRRQMGEHLDALEAQLQRTGGPWILGGQYTLADVGWGVIIQRLVQADSFRVFLAEGKRPACTEWWQRVEARPSHREAILEHAHPTIAYGTERLRKAKAADPALRVALEGS